MRSSPSLFLFSASWVVILGCCLGCVSIKSRQLFRSSDGRFSANCLPCPSRGVPCKFQIETGVRAEVIETYFINPEGGQVIVPQDQRILSVRTSAIKTDQNFVVHIPRPLAGTLNLTGQTKGYHFTEDGYLKAIGAEIEDRTIDDFTTLLGNNSLGGFLKNTAAGDPQTTVDGLESQTRVIAVRDFCYGDPEWHLEFNQWINQFQPCLAECSASCYQQNPYIPSSEILQPDPQ